MQLSVRASCVQGGSVQPRSGTRHHPSPALRPSQSSQALKSPCDCHLSHNSPKIWTHDKLESGRNVCHEHDGNPDHELYTHTYARIRRMSVCVAGDVSGNTILFLFNTKREKREKRRFFFLLFSVQKTSATKAEQFVKSACKRQEYTSTTTTR